MLLECLEAEVQGHSSQRHKAEKWQHFIAFCKSVWDKLQVEHHHKISENWAWPSNIYTAATWKTKMLDCPWRWWAASLQCVLQYMEGFRPDTPSKGEAPVQFRALFDNPQSFADSVQVSEDVEHRATQLPDLQAKYPVRYMDDGRLQSDLTRQAQNVLWSARDFFLDALCVSVKQHEITISLPLLLHSSFWSAPLEASKVAHALFLCFVEEADLHRSSQTPLVVRHKKEEVELQDELFVEAQCRSDRPGFAIVDADDRQVFKLYNAMGLGHQHEDLRTLLVRVRDAELAVQWCRFVSQESPSKFRASQVKGEEEALTHWGWREQVVKHNLASSSPLPSLPDWLRQNS